MYSQDGGSFFERRFLYNNSDSCQREKILRGYVQQASKNSPPPLISLCFPYVKDSGLDFIRATAETLLTLNVSQEKRTLLFLYILNINIKYIKFSNIVCILTRTILCRSEGWAMCFPVVRRPCRRLSTEGDRDISASFFRFSLRGITVILAAEYCFRWNNARKSR